MGKRVQNVVLDWHGVISDDRPAVFYIVGRIFQLFGREPLSWPEFRRNYTLPYMKFWKIYFPDLKKDESDMLYQRFYSLAPVPEIIPGAREFLQQLREMNMNLAILSSHPSVQLMQEMERYGLKDMFPVIFGGSPDKCKEIFQLLEQASFDPSETAFVGDMVHDVDAALIASVTPIALVMEGIGYQHKEVVLKSAPCVYESFEEVLNFLR